jgi:hypothetical protein
VTPGNTVPSVDADVPGCHPWTEAAGLILGLHYARAAHLLNGGAYRLWAEKQSRDQRKGGRGVGR